MLLLERNHNQSIIIDHNIKLTVWFKGTKIKIGITAPRDVEIWREELYERIKQEMNESQHEDAA